MHENHTPARFPSQLPMPAVARILSRFERGKLAAFIEVAIELADLQDAPADPDAPDFSAACDGRPGSPDDAEHDGTDQGDPAWVEWDRMRGSQKRGANAAGWSEDDEEDDGDGECTDDIPAFDPQSRRIANRSAIGAGCAINGDRELNGDEGDYGGEVDGI